MHWNWVQNYHTKVGSKGHTTKKIDRQLLRLTFIESKNLSKYLYMQFLLQWSWNKTDNPF